MKKKISVFALLLSLLVALVPPSSAKAGVGAYSENVAVILKTIPDDMRVTMEENKYIIACDLNFPNEIYLMIYDAGVTPLYVQSVVNGSYEYVAGVINSGVYCEGRKLYYTGTEWYQQSTGKVNVSSSSANVVIYASNLKEMYDKDLNLISDDIPTIQEFLGETVTYPFSKWCVDAGLNCQASSNESDSVIPYSYNDYWHIVRKTSSGKWLLTTIGNSVMADNLSDYTLMYSDDMGKLQVYNLYSGDDTNGYLLNIRQYEYDTDGWRLKSYVTEDSRDTDDCIIDLGVGSGIDDTKIIAYSSTDIYDESFSLVTPGSTEYVEPSAPVVTPEPTPGSGSSGSGDSDDTGSDDSGSSGGGRPGSGTRPSVGGEASGGGGLDFIINLFTLIWTKICSVPMAVDGYSISLQQIFVYGALVSIVGGFIIKFIFRR